MTVIDLGELTEPTDPQPSRRRRRTGSRRLPTALVALAALLTLGGAAPPAARIHATLPVGLASEVLLTANHIFTVTPVFGVTDGSQELVAYPRPRRATVKPQRLAPLWRVPVPSGHHVFQAESVDNFGVLVSTLRSRTTISDDNNTETVLLDTRTGQQRWRAPGLAALDASGRVLLRTWAVEQPITLRVVELASGRELWSKSMPNARVDFRARDGLIDAIVVATTAGDIEVLDPETGQLRHRLPAPADPAGYQQVTVVDDLVLVARNSRIVTAYDVDGLTRRWQTAVPLADYVGRCGDLLCTRTSQGGAHLLDPETGTVRYSSGATVEVMLAGKGRALVIHSHSGGGSDLIAVDLTTGRWLTEYGTWDMVSHQGYAPQLLGTRMLPDVGLLLARLDPAEPRARRIDVLVGAARECLYGHQLITCRRPDGNIGVWQVPD